MIEVKDRNIWGVVGGMGPLASAEFLRTIYEYSLGEREQDSPVVLMYSDPTFPDRTEALLSRSFEGLLSQLTDALRKLAEMGASKFIVSCVTIHYLLPWLPPHIGRHVVSLLDVIFEQVAQSRKKHLLICTNGTRQLGVFERHTRWGPFKHRIVLPDEKDQNLIHHDLIYRIKGNSDILESSFLLESLLVKYKVDSFIAGCTEVHLLTKRSTFSGVDQTGYDCIDPLLILARRLAKERV